MSDDIDTLKCECDRLRTVNAELLAILEVIEQAADMPFDLYDEVKAVIAKAQEDIR